MTAADLPTGPAGRGLALALLLLVLAVAYYGMAAPLIALYSERSDRLVTERMIAPRLHLAAAEMPQLQARVAGLRRSAGHQLVTLDGATDALAAADLQIRIERLAAAAAVALVSTDGLPAEPRAGYRRIGLRVTVSGSYDGIVKLLGAIETATPPLAVNELQIHARPVVAGALYAAQLDAGFAVYGLRSAIAPAAGAKP